MEVESVRGRGTCALRYRVTHTSSGASNQCTYNADARARPPAAITPRIQRRAGERSGRDDDGDDDSFVRSTRQRRSIHGGGGGGDTQPPSNGSPHHVYFGRPSRPTDHQLYTAARFVSINPRRVETPLGRDCTAPVFKEETQSYSDPLL